jgi:hypothetical protein
MLEGDSAEMCTEKFLQMLMGDGAEGLAWANLGARTPIRVSGSTIVSLCF